MTVAACFNCGKMKHGALIRCPECGVRPTSEDDIVLSLGLTDHFNTASQVRRLGGLIEAGTSVRLEIDMEKKLREDVRRSGLKGTDLGDSERSANIKVECTVDWKTVRVFISSTFSDMHSERDHLVRVVFPKVKNWCEKRGIDFRDVDLRWGVSREEAEDGRALDICLNEIDGSRPFFICLLGERYGWVPPSLKSDEYKLSEAHQGFSITHLEIIHAVNSPISRLGQSKPEVSSQTFFYFRDPDCIPVRPCQCHECSKKSASHIHNYFETDPTRKQLLKQLKQDISDWFRQDDCVSMYSGEWNPHAVTNDSDPSPGRLEVLSEFGRRVEKDLRQAIEKHFKHHIESILAATPQERATSVHRANAERLRRTYVDRFDIQRRIVNCIENPKSPLTLVTGPQGCGKSSLLSWLVKSWGGARIVCRYIGVSGRDATASGLWSGIFEDLLPLGRTDGLDLTSDFPLSYDDLCVNWPIFMHAISNLDSVVIFFDGVERLSSKEIVSLAALLSNPRPSSVKVLVAGTVQDSTSEEFWYRQFNRLNCDELKVEDLSESETKELIKHYPSVFCKKFSPDQIRLLLDNPATRNPLFLSIALEEIRVFGSFDLLDQRLNDLPWLFSAADHGQNHVATDIATCLKLLYEQVLLRVLGDIPASADDAVARFFGLLACSRDGLTEIGLEELVSQEVENGKEAKEWTQVVLRLIRDHLQHRYVLGSVVLDFAHPLFKDVVTQHFIQNKQDEISLRTILAEYHGIQPLAPAHPECYKITYAGDQFADHLDHMKIRQYDSHNINSWLWQLTKIGDWSSIQAAISRPEVFQAIWEIDEREAATWWERIQVETGVSMADAYSDIIKTPVRFSMRLLWAVGRLLSENGYPVQAIRIQQELVKRTVGLQPGDTMAISNLIITLRRLDDSDRAIELIQAECDRLESEGNEIMLPPLLLSMGHILANQDQPEQALAYLRRASLLTRKSRVFHDLLGEILILRALSHSRLGEIDTAMRIAERGVASFKKIQNPVGLSKALRILASIQEHSGKDDLAMNSRKEADDIETNLS